MIQKAHEKKIVVRFQIIVHSFNIKLPEIIFYILLDFSYNYDLF